MSFVNKQQLLMNRAIEGNFLTPYLGAELAFVGGFFRRNPSYTGIVATLRRLSDSATHDLYFNGANEIDWADSTLLSFVSGAEVEVKEIYNQFPSANWLVEKVTAPDGRGATLYEGGSFNTLTGKTQKAMIFNGSDEYYQGDFTLAARRTAYIGAVGEASAVNTNNQAINITRQDSQNARFGLRIRNDLVVGQTVTSNETRTLLNSNTINTPVISGYSDAETSRVLSKNESDVASETFSLTGDSNVNSLIIGQLRGDLPSGNWFNGKLSEVWAFFDAKTADRTSIEATINLDYSL